MRSEDKKKKVKMKQKKTKIVKTPTKIRFRTKDGKTMFFIGTKLERKYERRNIQDEINDKNKLEGLEYIKPRAEEQGMDNLKIIFKNLIVEEIPEGYKVEDIEKIIERRNPDVEIDETVWTNESPSKFKELFKRKEVEDEK